MKAQRRKVPIPRAALTVATPDLPRNARLAKTRLLELSGQESDADKVRPTSEEALMRAQKFGLFAVTLL
ncbi:MAG TPA: hypothetical protein VL866_15430 [Pyrinomonadaceae bacterium]|nr:hypothetical protein [Pyrinomonadaceae bacterium]